MELDSGQAAWPIHRTIDPDGWGLTSHRPVICLPDRHDLDTNTQARHIHFDRRAASEVANGGETMRRDLCMLMAGMALGAGLMYVFDPQAGRRRQALMRDKMSS